MKSAYDNNKALIQKSFPSMAFDGKNYEKWKIRARGKLSQLLGMDKFTYVPFDTEIEYEKKTEKATEIRFTFQSEKGYRVPCQMMIPIDANNPPVMICLQGHSTGMHISLGIAKYAGDREIMSEGDRDFCVRAVKEGFAAVALEQRNFGECGGFEKRTGCFESALTALLIGRTTIGERVWDISRLIDVLESDFAGKVDTDKICCMGNSGGGTATAYAAALEDRIALCMPSCAMCTFKDSIGAMEHCACNYVPHIAEYFDMDDLMAMACPKYYIQVSGAEDPIFPFFGAEKVFEKGKKAYEACGKGNLCTLVKGNGGHRFYADDAWQVVHKYIGF